jgi:P4 family phage/plasmid primase-like protien
MKKTKFKTVPETTKAENRSLSINDWFTRKFPGLSQHEYGRAILEGKTDTGANVVIGFSEPYLAATLGEQGTPNAPTIYIGEENRFYTYSPDGTDAGIFVWVFESQLRTRLARLLLQAAHENKGTTITTKLEFALRDSVKLNGPISHAKGLLIQPVNFFKQDLTEFIPCRNGMLRLGDMQLLPFSPSYRRRNKLDVDFQPGSKCNKLFLETLMHPALPADDLDLLQRVCGLYLVGVNLAQAIVLLIGTAGGGKGTFIRVLKGVLGHNNIVTLRTSLLGERFETSRYVGKTLLYGADVPANFLNRRGASVLKSLVGGDPMTVEFKGSNKVPEISGDYNVIASCNSQLLVRLEGDQEAWRRRLRMVSYENDPPQNVIVDLHRRIIEQEGPGVLNWMLEGLRKIRGDGWQLFPTSQQQARVDRLLLESDSISIFVREDLIRDDDGELTVFECHAGYIEFCNKHDWSATARKQFNETIADRIVHEFGIALRHDITPTGGSTSHRGWKGIRLRHPDE